MKFKMSKKYDFCGWATKNDIRCSDGRTIRRDAFKDCDGKTVPLVWNHQHNDVGNVLGHAVLENREGGVYAYGYFNDTENAQAAKTAVQNGDISALSIYANQLAETNHNVNHGVIREVSLVLAGANPGASIDTVVVHSDGSLNDSGEEGVIYSGEPLEIYHSEEDESMNNEHEETVAEIFDTLTEKQKTAVYAIIGEITGANGNDNGDDDDDDDDDEMQHSAESDDFDDDDDNDETVQDVFDTLTPKQQDMVYTLIDAVIDDEEDPEMKHNIFENDTQENVLTHADQEGILNLAKSNSCGSLQAAIEQYSENNEALAHGIDAIETLFPEYEDIKKGAPEKLERDQSWVGTVMNGVHKSPISRIRTRQADVRDENLNALGYQKGAKKKIGANIKLLKRTTDPQTVYRKDFLNRDDIVDITDFDVVEYQYGIMRANLEEEIAKAILIGDGRDEGSDDKIHEEHIRPIWTDDELYTIHADIDMEAMKSELQGTETGAHFGENYIYAEAVVQSALYAREKYKGSGNLTMFCTPHLLNVMLLARDLNGRRIYGTKTELEAALNVTKIVTVEQFEGKVRTDSDSHKHKLLALFTNLGDYYVGSTKGGEITRFNQFDIDFNQEKYLIETRLSGAQTRVFGSIALEEPVAGD